MDSPRQRMEFIRFPWQIYGSDSRWVAPIIADQKKTLDPRRGPFYDYGRVQLYMAYVAGKPVGRISAHINPRHDELHGDEVGFFGFFECIHNPMVAEALFQAAESYLRGHGKRHIEGPYSFGVYDELGVQVNSFDTAPYVMTAHNPPYYAHLLEHCGFHKAVDWFAFRVTHAACHQSLPSKYSRVYQRVMQQGNMTLRKIDTGKGFDRDSKIIQQIFNQAWMQNWGHVPLTDNEYDRIVEFLRFVVCPDLSLIAEVDGQPVGCSIVLYDANETIRKLNGRLFPLGFFKLLFGIKKTNRARLILMGMLDEYRGKGYDLGFYLHLVERCQKFGIEEFELSVVVETNRPLLKTLEKLPGVERYKTYRIFQRPIQSAVSTIPQILMPASVHA